MASKRILAETDLSEFAKELRPLLESIDPFVLWLQGEMGSGKTTFVREYLRSCGLNPATPVVSPTYTIVNDYRINDDWYAHLDLYRAEDNFLFEELGLHDTKTFRGFFVEWPEQTRPVEWLKPTHQLKIEYLDARRSYEFSVVKDISS